MIIGKKDMKDIENGKKNYQNDNMYFRIAGWALSLLCMLAGSYFLWPHIHVALLGIVFFYAGIRVFNFSTFKEYEEDRRKLLFKLTKW
jgi:hypothetical protein